jgi:cytochrome c oxidase assembly protein subunit 15
MGVTPLLDGRRSTSSATLHRLAIATLVANIVIVVTGGAVRLTGSGLGCPTWPRCTDESFVAHGALGAHGVIEFGNRLLTFALAAIAVATWGAAMRSAPARRSVRVLATLLALGVPAQAALGGVTVLTDLNPWIVSGHLLLSLAMIGLSVLFLRRLTEGDRPPVPAVPLPIGWLVRGTFVAAWVVFYAGTVVTGSGPHAGDADAPRTGLDPASVSQMHADLVFLLVGLTIGCNLALRAAHAPAGAVSAATWLLALEVVQGAVGLVQYATNLPVILVGLHLMGAALLSASVTWLLVSVRLRT